MDVDAGLLRHFQDDPGNNRLLETGCLDFDTILTGRKRGHGVVAGVIGGGEALEVGLFIDDTHLCGRHGGARRIKHDTGERGIGHLGSERQPQATEEAGDGPEQARSRHIGLLLQFLQNVNNKQSTHMHSSVDRRGVRSIPFNYEHFADATAVVGARFGRRLVA